MEVYNRCSFRVVEGAAEERNVSWWVAAAQAWGLAALAAFAVVVMCRCSTHWVEQPLLLLVLRRIV